MPRITTAAELDHAITELVQATTEQDAIGAKVSALRAIVEPAVRARITKADRWTRERLGVVSWQVGKPAPGVIDQAALAAYLVDYLPDEVEVTVKIRAVDLDLTREAFEMAGVTPLTLSVVPRPAYVTEMLKRAALVPDAQGEAAVTAVDRESGEAIPGVGEVIPPSSMVLRVEPTLKAAHKVSASAWVEDVLAHTPTPLEDIADTEPLPIEPAGTSPRYIQLAGLTLDDLKVACRVRGLGVTGSKADLVGRIETYDSKGEDGMMISVTDSERGSLVNALRVYALHMESTAGRLAAEYGAKTLAGRDARSVAVKVADAMLEHRESRALADRLAALMPIGPTTADTALAEAVSVLAESMPPRPVDTDEADANIERSLTLIRGAADELDPDDPEESA